MCSKTHTGSIPSLNISFPIVWWFIKFAAITSTIIQREGTVSSAHMVLLHQLDFSYMFVAIILKQMTPEKVITIIRFSVALSFCWPLPMNSSRNQIFGYKVAQMFSIVNVNLLLLPCFYAIYLRSDDIEIVAKCISQSICQIQSIAQTVTCFCKHDTLQVSLYSLFIIVLRIWDSL